MVWGESQISQIIQSAERAKHHLYITRGLNRNININCSDSLYFCYALNEAERNSCEISFVHRNICTGTRIKARWQIWLKLTKLLQLKIFCRAFCRKPNFVFDLSTCAMFLEKTSKKMRSWELTQRFCKKCGKSSNHQKTFLQVKYEEKKLV